MAIDTQSWGMGLSGIGSALGGDIRGHEEHRRRCAAQQAAMVGIDHQRSFEAMERLNYERAMLMVQPDPIILKKKRPKTIREELQHGTDEWLKDVFE